MRLYHYTDLSGLKGIIQNKSLWATHIFFMNDKNESIHGFQCLKNTVESLNPSIFSEQNKEQLINAINQYDIYSKERALSKESQVYNLSFCLENDKLSQWRGYGKEQGVCLEFDKDELLDRFNCLNLNVVSDEVIYTEENATVEMNNKIMSFFEKRNSTPSEDGFEMFCQFHNMVGQLIPFFKNQGFIEEREFRIVFTPFNELPDISFRTNNNSLVPYINAPFDKNGKIPLKSITIGPAKDKDYTSDGIRFFLDYHGYDNVKIEYSAIPYRT